MGKILSTSALALLFTTPYMVLAAEANNSKADSTESRKERVIQGDGLEIVAQSKDDMPKALGLEISGGTSFNMYGFGQFLDAKKKHGTHFGADNSRINFEVLGKTGPELGSVEYSFLIGLSGNTEAGKTSVEENRIKLKTKYFTWLGGVHRGVTDFMSVGGFTFYGGTGGVLGNYKAVINETAGSVLRDDPAGHGKDRTKTTLVTPRFMVSDFGGFQFGYSYTPDGEHQGEAKLNTVVTTTGTFAAAGKSLHEFGVNFKGEAANGLIAQISFTTLLGKAKALDKNGAPGAVPVAAAADTNLYGQRSFGNIKSYAIGLMLSYAGFSVGGEYLNNGSSLSLGSFSSSSNTGPGYNDAAYTVSGADAGRVYNFGAGYEFGKHKVTLGYLNSTRNLGTANLTNATANAPVTIEFGSVDARVLSTTYDYKLAKGLKVYAEATHFDTKHNGVSDNLKVYNQAATGATSANGSNNGNAFVAGIAVSF